MRDPRPADEGRRARHRRDVQLPLSMMNRHGLVAGATGTGKTKTLQIMAGQLSAAGVPVFISDIKGDVTGLSRPGDATSERVRERSEQLGIAVRAARASRRTVVALRNPRRTGARDRLVVRPAAPRQGPRPEQDAGLGAHARVHVLRRPAAAAARPHRPPHHLEVPLLRRGRAGPRGVRRVLEGDDRRPAALDRRARGRRAPTRSSGSRSSTSRT